MSDEEVPTDFVVHEPPSSFHFIIPNECCTHVLVKRTTGEHSFPVGFQLPELTVPTDNANIPSVNDWASQTGDLCSVSLHYLGLRLYLRDIVWRNPNLSFDREENILVADLLGPSTVPPPFSWSPLEQVKTAVWECINRNINLPSLIEDILYSSGQCLKSEQASQADPFSIPFFAQPWRQLGWYSNVEHWFRKTMDEKSVRLRKGGYLTQVCNAPQSTVLQYPLESAPAEDINTLFNYKRATKHYVFLKSSCTSVPEALITESVASHLPKYVPKVVAVKDDYTFIQIGAAGSASPSPREILHALVDIQHRSLSFVKSLQAAGVPYHGLDWHAKNLESVLHHPSLKLFAGNEFYVNLVNHLSDLQTLFAELAAYKIPQTLIHGDFDSLNVLQNPREKEAVQVIDWASSAIGHPFVDFLRFTVVDDYGTGDDDAKSYYLRQWERFESRDNIKRAVGLAYPVMLCENLCVVLKQHECAGSFERETFQHILHERLCSISGTLAKRRHNICTFRDESDAVSLLLISKECGRYLLVRHEGVALSLPVIRVFDIAGTAATDNQLDGHGIRVMIQSQLGIDVRVVRSLWLNTTNGKSDQRCALILEMLNTESHAPPGHFWIDSNCTKIFLNGREERVIVEAFFREVQGGRDAGITKMHWQQFGWLAQMSKWAESQLLRVGLHKSSEFEEVRTSLFGTVWKANVKKTDGKHPRNAYSSTESVFLKASILNKAEGSVLSEISSFTKNIPSVIGVNPNTNTFLMEGKRIDDQCEMDWPRLFHEIGRLHANSVAHIDGLVNSGLLQRFDCCWMRQNVKRLFQRCIEFLGKEKNTLEMMTFPLRLVEGCLQELEALSLPLTLVHGDLHLGNIGQKTATGYMILDWSSAFVGVPLCDLAVMTKLSDEAEFGDGEDWQSDYMSAWEEGKMPNMDFGRAVKLSLVYYWILNIHSLLALAEEIDTSDVVYLGKLLSEALEQLESAAQQTAT